MDHKTVRAMGRQESVGNGEHRNTDVAAIVDVSVEIQIELIHFVRHLLQHRAILREAHLLVAGRHHFGQHRDLRHNAVRRFQFAGVGTHQIPATRTLRNQHISVRMGHTEIHIDPQRRNLAHPDSHHNIVAPKRIHRHHHRLHLRDNPHPMLLHQVEGRQVQTAHVPRKTLLKIEQHRMRTEPVVLVHVLTGDCKRVRILVHSIMNYEL